jgi:hypothetical protein
VHHRHRVLDGHPLLAVGLAFRPDGVQAVGVELQDAYAAGTGI